MSVKSTGDAVSNSVFAVAQEGVVGVQFPMLEVLLYLTMLLELEEDPEH